MYRREFPQLVFQGNVDEELLQSGTPEQVARHPVSLTGHHIRAALVRPLPQVPPKTNTPETNTQGYQ